MKKPFFRIEFSLRYCVIGWYVDRGGEIVRVYPAPFCRISIGVEEE